MEITYSTLTLNSSLHNGNEFHYHCNEFSLSLNFITQFLIDYFYFITNNQWGISYINLLKLKVETQNYVCKCIEEYRADNKNHVLYRHISPCRKCYICVNIWVICFFLLFLLMFINEWLLFVCLSVQPPHSSKHKHNFTIF